MFNELRELTLVGLVVTFSQLTHVISNMLTKNVLAVNLGIELLGLRVVTRETLHAT